MLYYYMLFNFHELNDKGGVNNHSVNNPYIVILYNAGILYKIQREIQSKR